MRVGIYAYPARQLRRDQLDQQARAVAVDDTTLDILEMSCLLRRLLPEHA